MAMTNFDLFLSPFKKYEISSRMSSAFVDVNVYSCPAVVKVKLWLGALFLEEKRY